MELPVERLSETDSYRGIVRVGRDVLNKIGISPGDYIIIAGKRETCAKVWATSARSKIWMDEITVKNAGVNFGESVTIAPTKPRIAEFLEIGCKDQLSTHTWLPNLVAKSEEELIKLIAKGRAVVAGDLLAFRGPSSNYVVVFKITKTIPDGFVVIGDNTKIELKIGSTV
ncbi:MAG TPA: hypothetical protein ENG16_00480 [Archaeoglobus sp.]|nr:hypothetical protein [Archaeoglobus sp.]